MNMKENYGKKEKKHIILQVLIELIFIFMIATFSIVLYDMYINIDVDEEIYSSKKISQEVSTKETEDISTVLSEVSKSVVRNFKTRKK